MANETKIEWADSTFNPWIGCTRVSPACDDCYAARSTPARTLGVAWGAHEPRRLTSGANWKIPLQWQRKAEAFRAQHGRRRRVFCASLADVFDNAAVPEWRQDLFELIRITPDLDWLLLTKRPQNIVGMVRRDGSIAGNGIRYLPDNVVLGTTVEDQKRADMNIPALQRTVTELGARRLFVSVEPMLEEIDLRDPLAVEPDRGSGWRGKSKFGESPALHWVICGGESGPNARVMQREWARSLRDQCAAAGVPFLFKQWGEWAPNWLINDEDGSEIAGSMWMDRMGKKTAGRLLDGVEHNGFYESHEA